MTQRMAKTKLTVTFRVVLSKDFKLDPNDGIYICFDHKELGGWLKHGSEKTSTNMRKWPMHLER